MALTKEDLIKYIEYEGNILEEKIKGFIAEGKEKETMEILNSMYHMIVKLNKGELQWERTTEK